MSLDTTTIVAIFSGFGGLVACLYYMQSIVKNFQHDKEVFEATILQKAKEAVAGAEAKLLADRQILLTTLSSKIDAVETDLENHKREVTKDLSHIRETYNGEIRNLGDKIEGLRRELRDQHGQLVGLLSEMIKKSD